MIIECPVCFSQLAVDFYARLEHHEDGSHTVHVADGPDSHTFDPYDDCCPTCDALNPTHTPTCSVVAR